MLLYDSAQITRHIAGHITTNDSGDVYEVEVVDNDDVRIIRHEARMAAGVKPVLNTAECVHLRAEGVKNMPAWQTKIMQLVLPS